MGGTHPLHSLMSQDVELPAVQRFVDISVFELPDIHGRAIDLHLVALDWGEVVSKSDVLM